jgi:hypothetical protein
MLLEVAQYVLFDTSLKSESVSVIASDEGLSLVHFTFSHRFSLTILHSLVLIT